ncbi:MAG: riboflavin synthase, partial [Candidatus Omnitrophica bacterium]|nr:riboflavin synthase [Candidatus Omnitrophota bacterium]
GDSVSVNGACLTLTGKIRNVIDFDVMGETVRRTNLGKVRVGDLVNLEDSLKVGEYLSGHFVSGHIDCVGKIKDIRRSADDVSVEVVFPEGYSALAVEKGPITLDGISLTVGKAGKGSVTVYIIPHTLKMTTLGFKKIGDEVNMEFDLIGKYVVEKSKLL